YSTLRNAISTRLSARGTFRVRTPSAVLGHRGYKAHETVLNGYLEDPASQVRWQRVLDDAFPEDGILPIETLEDGPLVGGSSVTGTHEPTLRLSGFTEHDVGTYLMRTIPPGGTIDDSEVVTTIRVVEDVGQPVFAEQPQGKTVSPALFANGGTVSFAAPAVASSNDPDDPIIYQWFVNGQMPWYDWAGSEHGDAILVGPYWNAATSGPTLTISSFQPGAGSDIHNVVFWLECEAMNSHGSTRTRPIPFVIDIDTDDCDGNGITDAAELAAGAIDANGDGIPDGCQCLPDLNSDGMVDGGDLGRLLSHWGPTQPNADSERCDLNADGRIDGADLGVMLSGWGACGG
ncbi:MAG: hypothetical protein EBU31_03530, partial [Proteobacteria bacterium]|nr:hypothetical protein [Pseudomonadota bacterium]